MTLVFGAGLWSPSWTTWKALATSKHTHTHIWYMSREIRNDMKHGVRNVETYVSMHEIIHFVLNLNFFET